MERHLKGLALVLIGIMGFINIGYTQSIYKVKDTKDIVIKLTGTSTMHEWKMDALSTTGEAQFDFKSGSTNDLVLIKSLSFKLKVVDLKSDDKALNNNAYKALKSDEFKEIHYKLTSSTLSPEKEGYLVKSVGLLTIAGFTNEIHMDVHCEINADGSISTKGAYQLNMTDYNVIPPSFMWGAMKTGDAITLNFAVVYQK